MSVYAKVVVFTVLVPGAVAVARKRENPLAAVKRFRDRTHY